MSGVYIQSALSGTEELTPAPDLRGLYVNRPLPNAVPVGATYWAVDHPAEPGTVYVNNGTFWTAV